MDFCNPYVDFNKFVIKLPCLQIDVLRYWNSQPLRYIAKSRDGKVTFFVIEFALVENKLRVEGDEKELQSSSNEETCNSEIN